MQASLEPAQPDLMDIVIGHLDQLAQTGCVRAGHRARLLLDHMDDDPGRTETSAMLRRLLQRLQQGLTN